MGPGMPPVSPVALQGLWLLTLLPPILTTSGPGTTLCFSLFYFTPESCWACVTQSLGLEFWVELAKGRHWKEIGGHVEGGTDGAPLPPNPLTAWPWDPGGQPSRDGDSSLLMLTLGA